MHMIVYIWKMKKVKLAIMSKQDEKVRTFIVSPLLMHLQAEKPQIFKKTKKIVMLKTIRTTVAQSITYPKYRSRDLHVRSSI